MKLLTVQIALFVEKIIERPDLLMNRVNEKLGNIMDAMPTIQNFPSDFPVDIPLAQVNSTNGKYALNVCRGRIDLLINFDYKLDIAVNDQYKQIKATIEKYYKSVVDSIPVVRMGIICTLFEPIETNVQAIYEKYLKVPCPAGTVEASIRTNTQSLQKNIVYNSVKSVQAAEIHVGNDTNRGVIIQLDINNAIRQEILSLENLNDLVVFVGKRLAPKEVKELI